jgi:tRNA(Ile)-lysidine synthase
VTELKTAPELLDRFRADLEPLVAPGERIGIAVSGGPDSLALLLLAAAVRPQNIETATVDHALRPESGADAIAVADVCARLEVPHRILVIDWDEPPGSAIQEQARLVRYAALAAWMRERALDVLLTGHHLDDQAETLLMRLLRGAGVRGLAGMRPASSVPGAPDLRLVRPLLSWRRSELEALCKSADVTPVRDPSNADERHERVRVRRAMTEAHWLDPEALARSASHLAAADEALAWAARHEWDRRVTQGSGGIRYLPSDAPAEIRRRIVARAVTELATEGSGEPLRGRELDRLLADLEAGGTATLRGVRCQGGDPWQFTPAAPRRKSDAAPNNSGVADTL